MFREINHIYKRLNITADAIISGLAYMISLRIAGLIHSGTFTVPQYAIYQEWLVYPIMIIWPLLLNLNGLYPTNRLRSFVSTANIVIRTGIQGLLILLAILFVIKFYVANRIILAGFTVLSILFLIIKEAVVTLYIKYIRRSGRNIRNVLIVGEPDNMSYVIKKVEQANTLGLKLVGLLVLGEEMTEKNLFEHTVLGTSHDIKAALHDHHVDTVIIATSIWPHYEEVENIIAGCEEEGVEVWLPARIFHTKIVKPEGDEFLEMPMFVFRTEPKFSWQLFTKIALDRITGLGFSMLTLPVVLAAGILIKLTSPGPMIFKQERCGYHGRRFTMYKLRTMRKDAEATKAELAGLNIVKGPAFKLDSDPRITPLGRILRKTSIDELPQFWNVLMGEMSLVGPRPPVPEEVAEYKGWQRRRLSMKPGITGLVQVSGRSSIKDFDKWVDLDLEYIDNWSLAFDMKIIMKTVFVVLSTKGAK